MSCAAILDVRAMGPENVFLNEKPTTSFFIATYARHYPFARESVELPVVGQSGWRATVWVNLGKRGDLVGRFYWAFHYPGIRHKFEKHHKRRSCYKKCDDSCSSSSSGSCSSSSGSCSSSSSRSCCDSSSSSSSSSCCDSSSSSSECCDSSSSSNCGTSSSSCTSTRSLIRRKARCLPKHWVHYINSAGHSFVDRVEWLVGGHVVDTHYGEWLEIWDEYTTPAGQCTDEIVGRFKTQYDLWLASRCEQVRYCKNRFSFCEWMSHAVPIVTVYWSSVQAKLYTRPLEECWISSDDRPPFLIDCERCLADTDLKIKCWAECYWVSKAERKEIDESNHEYLITQNQFDRHDLCSKSNGSDSAHSLPIKMQHTINEVIWTVQSTAHRRCKDWFNYSGRFGGDPIKTFRLRVNGGDRVQEREARWFRTIEPNTSHTRTPRRHIYNWAFAAFPERSNFPSGALNFSQVEDVIADIRLQECLGETIVTFWGRSYNLLRSRRHLLGTAFLL